MIKSHIGIMPLDEGEASEGKCGFKLIQYLSVGLPIVGSAVGMNRHIINDSVGRSVKGFEPETWAKAIMEIVRNNESYNQFCRNAVKLWVNNFSYENVLHNWETLVSGTNTN